MTAEEYTQLNRFEVSHNSTFEEFNRNLRFSENVIFECNTIHNTIKYVRIKCHLEFILFDMIECTASGGDVRCPYKRGSTRKSEIAERLYEGDWRIYKT